MNRKTLKRLLLALIVLSSFSSCSELLKIAQEVSLPTGTSPLPVSNTENIAGLKSSLNVHPRGLKSNRASSRLMMSVRRSKRS